MASPDADAPQSSILNNRFEVALFGVSDQGPLHNQHRNPVHNRISTPAPAAAQPLCFQAQFTVASWASQLLKHRGIKQIGWGIRALHRVH